MTIRKQRALFSLFAICIVWFGFTDKAAASALPEDGIYEAEYVVLQADNDNVSMANDYWEKPARVTIKDGEATVRLSINHSKWVTEFKVPGGGGYVDTKIVVSNPRTDVRTVEFAADVTRPIVSKIHVTVPDIDYDHDYTIRLAFDLERFKPAAGENSNATEAPKPAASEPPGNAGPTDEGTDTVTSGNAEPTSDGTSSGTDSPTDAVKSSAPEKSSPEESSAEEADSAASSEESEESGKPAAAASEPPASESPAGEKTASEQDKSAAAEVAAGGEQDSGAGTSVEATAEPLAAEAANEPEAPEVPKTASDDVERTVGDEPQNVRATEVVEEGVQSAQSSPGMFWWTPLLAVLLLVGGGAYVLKRNAANP
ncbi:NEAT domain-containing protein [Paenibacillus sp. TRM 82003]|nr:NEAT domain-containing protein [Paenibacillus sp. TRM 82003]